MAVKELAAHARGKSRIKSFEALAEAVGAQKQTVVPVLDLILIERQDHTSPSGLVLTAMASVPGPRYAKVLAQGPGRPSEWNAAMIPMPHCKPGDTILYHGGAGVEWEYEGRKCWWILPRDLIAVVG